MEQNLTIAASYFRPRPADLARRVAELIERFDLGPFASQKPETLSGGYRRRLMIARALVHRPRLLFLDEPTTGLDPQARMGVWDLVDGLRADGLGIVLTTHYMDEAERLSDALTVLARGRVVAHGTAKTVLGDLVGEHVVVLDAAAGRRGDGLAHPRAGGASRPACSGPGTCRSRARSWRTSRAPSRRCATRSAAPTLDDLFLKLVARAVSWLTAALEWQSRAVVARHLRVYVRNWHTAFLPPALEPVTMLLAFGVGLGGYVASLTWQGRPIEYMSYVAPGLLAYATFMTAIFQSLFGAFIRMRYQRTWEGQLTTQIELTHVVWGEVLWAGPPRHDVRGHRGRRARRASTRRGCSPSRSWLLPAVLPVAFVAGCAFAALGLCFTAILPTIDHMNLPIFLLVLPMGLLSSTYFPLEHPVLVAAQPGQPALPPGPGLPRHPARRAGRRSPRRRRPAHRPHAGHSRAARPPPAPPPRPRRLGAGSFTRSLPALRQTAWQAACTRIWCPGVGRRDQPFSAAP